MRCNLQDDINDLVYAFCNDCADDNSADDFILAPDPCDLSVSNSVGMELELSAECIDDGKVMYATCVDTRSVHMTCNNDSSTPEECILEHTIYTDMLHIN